MAMSKNLHSCLAAIQHNVNGSAQDPKIRYKAYKLILAENFGVLPAQRQLEAATSLHYPPAQIDLAVLFLNGQYIEKTEDGFQSITDCERAVRLLKEAAETGDPTACLLLAACCCKGIGCTQSNIEAEKYINRIDRETLRRFLGESENWICPRSHMLQRVVELLEIWPIRMLYAGIKREGVNKRT